MVETIYFSGLLGDRRVGFYAGYQVPIRAQIMGGSAWDAEYPSSRFSIGKKCFIIERGTSICYHLEIRGAKFS